MASAISLVVLLLVLLLVCPSDGYAGGSGLNVLIVANEASSESLELANEYRLRRQVPIENVLRISWPSNNNIEWTHEQFTNALLNPVLNFVARERSNQIHYVLLCMDIPYRITGGQANSTTAALFYGFKPDTSGSDLDNTYALSEARFADAKPATAPTNSFLTMMITADSLTQAKQVIAQGVASDSTFPSNTAWLAKSDDPARNIRFKAFDNAIFNTRLGQGYSLQRTNLNSPLGLTNILGYQTGLANFSVSPNTFIPGAIADSMTSFGGQIFEDTGQTTLLEFIDAGAAGSYGTVTEPLVSPGKFPDPMVYFYQLRGFSLAECYYQSVQQPFQGLFVGEPLAAPWRQAFSGGWSIAGTNVILNGTTNLCLRLKSDTGNQTLDRIDLFIDGAYVSSLTNLPPHPGNRLTVRLNGYPVEYQVPSNASLQVIAAGLAANLNLPDNTNVTQVIAQAIGDKIELQSVADPLPEGVFEFVDIDATFSMPRSYLAAPRPVPLEATVSASGLDENRNLRIAFTSAVGVSNALQASTNLADWVTIASNPMGGAMEFIETDVLHYSQRYYRTVAASPTPYLKALGADPTCPFIVHIQAPPNHPYIVQASSDLNQWSDVLTNEVGGEGWFTNAAHAGQSFRYYRTRSADSNDYAPVTVVGQTSTGGNILQIHDTSPGDTVVWASTNETDWIPIYTHTGSSAVQTEVESTSSSDEPLTTHLRTARPEFLASTAFGTRAFILNDFNPPPVGDGKVPAGSYLQLSVTKTNGSIHTVSLTNDVPNADLSGFVSEFFAAINNAPTLQQSDGVVAEDLGSGPFQWSWSFNLRARSPGLGAAKIHASLTASSGLLSIPSTSVTTDENVSDLRPRNHLYVSAGMSSTLHCFDLDTTLLSDGYHELTAVAYEGTHVSSQTVSTLPVIVSNSPLQATLTLPSANSTNLVSDSFDLEVLANTNSVDEIHLFTTGGSYDSRTNQQTATITVNGMDLGVGEHSFYAVVRTTDGRSYRTARLNVTLTH